ncbi:FAD-dependent monooxygenase [Streptomyces lunaelactis]|uniref:FAD-dependent monooxygenase n=1 Tax=Streptomyces lunaelactis TaxID=1535768 RepID=UPI0015859FDA|nr:FAD-dependent monooxygenase [Streptomyces lunaelactis]NUK36303.1 FAD-dependent monooxygenase [Streptomyces lunaelactis]NUK42827.1 FAD-dependent monooxygenase [Streptomyces lunaelactis]NUK72885.1 FAD-dependent monooxygenase [Streptomyces lunaelactis]NUK81423.1 FAD-dependent monooxygenase [Streptomyces lunaelactis]NUK96085.1 FAD-dependent monooxygenase [Streptomyces lunaelactis]
MVHTEVSDVLVAGAGPVGLTAAAELRRRGVACRIVDRLPARLPFAKAVGIQPRTLEIWDRMGLVRAALDAAVPMRGQLIYVNGAEQARLDLVLPPEVPYGFAALPQYETERILEEFLARFGTRIERGTELLSFTQDADGVTSRLLSSSGAEEEVRSRFLVGCDGAHSIVRKTLGLTFEGGAFPEEYMLADVEVDWDLPPGYGVRAMHHDAEGAVDDVLVCIPLPGPGRYRMSMLVPPELSTARRTEGADQDGVAHGLEGGRAPALPHIQAVLDRLSPQPTTASAMRWSSVFRISHRLVDRYADGRVFVAGDAAHIHPPTGAQGMNTGIQDAYNLAWKLALTAGGSAHPQLLASYDAERRPIGEEVVGRTVRHATEGIQADPTDPATLMLREAQLLVGYRGSPIVGRPHPDGDGAGPQPGDRAPDCGGLTGEIAAYPLRLYDLLRDRGHVLLLYGNGPPGDGLDELAAAARELSHGQTEPCVVLADGAPANGTRLPVYRDSRGEFARAYGAQDPTGFVVRPDGYLGTRLCPPTTQELAAHLACVFRS